MLEDGRNIKKQLRGLIGNGRKIRKQEGLVGRGQKDKKKKAGEKSGWKMVER